MGFKHDNNKWTMYCNNHVVQKVTVKVETEDQLLTLMAKVA